MAFSVLPSAVLWGEHAALSVSEMGLYTAGDCCSKGEEHAGVEQESAAAPGGEPGIHGAPDWPNPPTREQPSSLLSSNCHHDLPNFHIHRVEDGSCYLCT